MTHVEIDAAGRRVSVRHNGDLTEVTDSAIRAWRSTGDTPTGEQPTEPERLGSVGFCAGLELAPPTHDIEGVTAR